MKLTTVEITEFQSIRKSNPFTIGDITCLVGKNEAGKTALLQALYRLNPILANDSKYEVTDDYPRASVEDYRQEVENGIRKPAIVASATYTLNDEDLKPIEKEFGKGVLEISELVLSRGYDSLLHIALQVDETKVIKSVIDKAQLPSELASKLSKISSIQELDRESLIYSDEQQSEHIDRLRNELDRIQSAQGIQHYIFNTFLKERVPQFLYFDEYYQMKGQVNLDHLKARMNQGKLEKPDYPLLGFLELARLNIDKLINTQRTEELVNKLEGASNYLSNRILKYWSQNKHLQLRFDVRPAKPGDPDGMQSGTNLWTRVYDSKHFVTTPLGTRSRGFVWFFSFLAWFDQQQKKNKSIILLLDEPGLFLHGKAQGDLLRFMEEELKENHQVIYTTHSPFMVDPHKFDRVRIVQDKSMDAEDKLPENEEGTKVFSDVLEATDDSLFPLQGALGYELHQTLFIGPNNLVVEGVSDLIYLQTISGILERTGREGLSPDWTIVPVGGADKVPTFVSLLGSQKGLKIATLVDFQKKDKQLIDNLYKKKLLKKQNVLTFADFTGQSEADIEDMFTQDFYLRLVNSEYKKELSEVLSEENLKSRSSRILVKIDEYLLRNPLKNRRIFSHYRPARYFSENIVELEEDIHKETLSRFESAFSKLNALL